jgi:DNA repair photolyase
LKGLAELNLVSVTLSVTTLNRELSRKLEPRTSVPKKRLETVEKMRKNNIPCGINLAPIIPGLNDEEIPAILKAASEGALWAGRVMLRLPHSVKQLFVDWLHKTTLKKNSKF